MRITRIKRTTRAPDRLVIEVDGARFASLPVEVVQRLGLSQGLVLDADQQERLAGAVAAQKAFDAAVRMVTARPRAVNELLLRLRAKGHAREAAEEAVGRLEAAGILDDVAFARHFARTRVPRGYGRSRLLRDLLARGVERRVAEVAVDQELADAGVDAAAQVEELARRRAAQLRDVEPEKRVRRIVGYLERRGHAGADVLDTVREVVAEQEAKASV